MAFGWEFWQGVGWGAGWKYSLFLPQTSQILWKYCTFCIFLRSWLQRSGDAWGKECLQSVLGLYALPQSAWAQSRWGRFAHKLQSEQSSTGKWHWGLICNGSRTEKVVREKPTPEYFRYSLADSCLREKVLFINGIFSKPRCHTEKHAFNKMPFLSSLLFPPLTFGRGEGSVYNIDFFYWEVQMSPCLSRNRNVIERDVLTSYEDGYCGSGSFFQDCHFLSKKTWGEAARQMSMLQQTHPHFSRKFCTQRSWMQRRKGPDPCRDELTIRHV